MSKHQHNFLASDHSSSERKTWFVIILCGASMILEIGCGIRYGSLALIADGLHMSTHAFAFLITAVSYSYARKHADDQRFVFGTGKVGDLAAFTSAIILFLIALVILYEGLYRYFHPQQIRYREAIPIAFIGLAVNVVSGMILGDCFNCGSKAEHDGDGHGHSHGHTVQHFDYDIESSGKAHGKSGEAIDHHNNSHSSREHEHGQHIMGHGHEEHGEDNDHGHAHGGCGSQNHEEHDGHSHGAAHHAHEEETGHNHGYASYQRVDNNDDHGHGDYEERDSKGKVVTSKHAVDNNMRAAFVHVVSDAVVSLLVIVALVVAAYVPNCEYLDSTAGIVGSFVILNWAYVLAVDTSANLLDLNPDMKLTHHLREKLESDGSVVNDLHVWRLGPGHLGSIISVTPPSDAGGSGVTKNAVYYKQRLVGFRALSHTTVEVTKRQ